MLKQLKGGGSLPMHKKREIHITISALGFICSAEEQQNSEMKRLKIDSWHGRSIAHGQGVLHMPANQEEISWMYFFHFINSPLNPK